MSIILVFCMLGIISFMFFYTKDYINQLHNKIRSQKKQLESHKKTMLSIIRKYRKQHLDDKEILDYRNHQITILESELKFYKELSYTNINGKTKININKDKVIIDEAIKKAMLYSHPDKGLCKDANDFIKFRELYNSRKRA